jgi:hypothetical protein
MEMTMKRLLIPLAIASVTLAGSALAAPSAKFAAVWSETPVNLVSMVDLSGSVDDSDFNENAGFTFATIKVPQGKELLVGVSAEIGLVTDTSVKGKNGGEAKALAGAAGYVIVVAHNTDGSGDGATAAPGEVILSGRVQELEARLGGVIESCTDGDLDGTIVVADDCIVTDEEISLMQETLAAHHFNFILPDLPQGTYDITAYFTTNAWGEIDICEVGDTFCEEDPSGSVTASAYAKAYVGKYSLTVQQVRAVKNSLEEADIEVLPN